MKVIARTSAFSFKGKHEDVRQIARALGVTNVLDGSVRRSGARIRVTAQLIAAGDGAHLWSERFDRPMTDVFACRTRSRRRSRRRFEQAIALDPSDAEPHAELALGHWVDKRIRTIYSVRADELNCP